MDNYETTVIDTKSIADANVKKTLLEICADLEERGYAPVKQIVAYLISGDPGFISSYKNCRLRIKEFKREDIIETMLESFIKK